MFASTCTEGLRALIANEPRSYREVLADTLRRLRPRVEVSAIEPEALDAEVERLQPHLVVCSRARATIPDGTLTWVRLYPDGENLAEVVTAGGRATLVGVGLDDLLSVVDGTGFMRRTARTERPKAYEPAGEAAKKESA